MIKKLLLVATLLLHSTAYPKDDFSVSSFFKGALSPCMWVITQHAISPYYSSLPIRGLVSESGCDRMVVTYMEPDPSQTITAVERKMDILYQQLTLASPDMYLIFDEDMWTHIRRGVPPKAIDIARSNTVYVLPYGSEEVPGAIATKITGDGFSVAYVLEQFQLSTSHLYVISDRSRKSKALVESIRRDLKESGLKATVIVTSTIAEFRTELQKLNSMPRGVIINATVVLADQDTGIKRYRYNDYITDLLVTVNRVHVDIGFFRSLYNESIIIDMDTTSLAKILANAKRNGLGVLDRIDVSQVNLKPKIYIRPDRLRKRDVPYVNAFHVIDGILPR